MIAHGESDVPLVARPDEPPRRTAKPRHIVVAWWDRDITDLAKSVAMFAPAGSTITVISAEDPDVRAGLVCGLAAGRVWHALCACPVTPADLLRLGLARIAKSVCACLAGPWWAAAVLSSLP